MSASTVAMLEAERAHRAACIVFVPNYKHQGATEREIRFYSHCALELYPEPVVLDGPELVIAKIAVIILIGGSCFGAYRGLRDPYQGPIFGFFAGFMAALVFEVVMAAVCFAATFLFS